MNEPANTKATHTLWGMGRASPHFSPGAVMIAEDFGPVYYTGTCACSRPKA